MLGILKKIVISGFLLLALIIGGWFGYKKYQEPPTTNKQPTEEKETRFKKLHDQLNNNLTEIQKTNLTLWEALAIHQQTRFFCSPYKEEQKPLPEEIVELSLQITNKFLSIFTEFAQQVGEGEIKISELSEEHFKQLEECAQIGQAEVQVYKKNGILTEKEYKEVKEVLTKCQKQIKQERKKRSTN